MTRRDASGKRIPKPTGDPTSAGFKKQKRAWDAAAAPSNTAAPQSFKKMPEGFDATKAKINVVGQAPEPKKDDRGFLQKAGDAVSNLLFEKPESAGAEALAAATVLPIGKGAKLAKPAAKLARPILKTAEEVIQRKSAAKVARMIGATTDEVLTSMKSKGITKLSYKADWGKMGRTLAKWTGLGTIGGIISNDILITWYVLDNFIGGQKMYFRDLAESVKWDGYPREEAVKAMRKRMIDREEARDFINTSTLYNPTLMPFRKYILAGFDADTEIIEFYMQQASGMIDTTEEFRQGKLDK